MCADKKGGKHGSADSRLQAKREDQDGGEDRRGEGVADTRADVPAVLPRASPGSLCLREVRVMHLSWQNEAMGAVESSTQGEST